MVPLSGKLAYAKCQDACGVSSKGWIILNHYILALFGGSCVPFCLSPIQSHWVRICEQTLTDLLNLENRRLLKACAITSEWHWYCGSPVVIFNILRALLYWTAGVTNTRDYCQIKLIKAFQSYTVTLLPFISSKTDACDWAQKINTLWLWIHTLVIFVKWRGRPYVVL